ncbi:MAG: DUF5606 domain-containing protein [Saprospiraceae bacterium]|nr:DUF5606 domain-containing protein [Bacteroidia bacterium]NNF22330.1 DUF5606 domain-containing protein [Saprospiraceae bacterium]NNK89160.1 DUF5606 domain-containing protein [Saprospiraceae bacterium]
MNLEPFVAVSGVGGILKLVTSRNNGLILESLENGKTRFYSVRKHQFTPLGTVAIYTLEDTIALRDVFEKMLEQYEENPPVSPKAEQYKIEEYFESIIPDYDEDRVSINDMKKVIKWFNFMNERGLLISEEEE